MIRLFTSRICSPTISAGSFSVFRYVTCCPANHTHKHTHTRTHTHTYILVDLLSDFSFFSSFSYLANFTRIVSLIFECYMKVFSGQVYRPIKLFEMKLDNFLTFISTQSPTLVLIVSLHPFYLDIHLKLLISLLDLQSQWHVFLLHALYSRPSPCFAVIFSEQLVDVLGHSLRQPSTVWIFDAKDCWYLLERFCLSVG